MIMKTIANTLGIVFYVKKHKEIDEKSPVYVRITVNRNRVEFSIKKKIETKYWHKNKGRAIINSEENRVFNSYLEQIRSKIVNHYQDLMLTGKHVTANAIKDSYFGNDRLEFTLNKIIEYHNEQMKPVLAWGTLKNYYTTQRYLARFLKKKLKDDDIPLSEIDYKFISDFEFFLRKWQPVDHQRPLNNNGVMKHMERFRKMINIASKLEWMTNNPFANFTARFDKVEREFLTQDELQAIEEKEFDVHRLQQVRDLFIFSCYTGFAYIDVINLSRDNLSLGIDRSYWLSTKRQKSNVPVKVPLLPKPLSIIEKYENDPRVINRQKLLPGISNQKLNSYLKEIADQCGIRKNLTFHIARHTFATTVTLTNGVPIETVSKLLGHTKLSTTQIYAKVVETKLSQDMNVLKNKLEALENLAQQKSN